jgi:hypothetical protein
MGLLDEIATANQGIAACKFGRWFEEQDKKYQAELADALSSDFPTNTIWRVLINKHGRFVSAQAFSKHRQQRCACVSS